MDNTSQINYESGFVNRPSPLSLKCACGNWENLADDCPMTDLQGFRFDLIAVEFTCESCGAKI